MKKTLLALLTVILPSAAAWCGWQLPPASTNAAKPASSVDARQDAKEWWPHFLGPRGNGTAPDKNLNFDWKKNPPKTLWKIPLGDGFSSFAVVGERAFTMTQRAGRILVVCLDAKSGKEVWTSDVAAGFVDKQSQGPGPRATPTYHDGKLYCLLPMGELLCLAAADGKRHWAANQFKDTGTPNPAGDFYYWGVSVSPHVEGDLVIIQPGGDKNNSVAAYHKDTGKLVWTTGNDPHCYGSPQTVTIAGQRQLIVPTGKSVLGIEPTKGKILWRYEMSSAASTICSTPIWFDEQLWVSAAYQVGCGVVEIKNQGEQWIVKEKWRNKKSLLTLYSNAMIVDGYVYGCHGDLSAFMLKCVDPKTGDVKWDVRLEKRVWLLAADEHLLCWSETGGLKLLEANPKQYVEKGELPKLLAYKSWAAPVLADGRLYLRDQRNALCIDLRKP